MGVFCWQLPRQISSYRSLISNLMATDNMDEVKLLPQESLIKTGQLDHADWNYRPLLGRIQRIRFRYAVSLLTGKRYGCLLEIGYGSGVFMPELSEHCDALYGLDIHQRAKQVQELLANHDVVAELRSGDVTEMPFEDNYFDCIIALSTLEYVEDIESACREMKRILKSNGTVIVVTPGKSPVLDLGLRIVSGEGGKVIFANRRERLIPALLRHFSVEQRKAAPRIGIGWFQLYTILKLGTRR